MVHIVIERYIMSKVILKIFLIADSPFNIYLYFARKINLRISKNPILALYWGNKINIFISYQSKNKNESCFLPVCFDL